MPIQKSELLTPDELTKVLQVAENGRDRAFIHVLYESGCRIGEIGGLCRRDVHFDTYGVQINVTGKTGSRPIRLVKSAGDFSFWFKHQVQQTPDTPIWSPYGRPDEFLTYARLSAILKLHFKLAGIDKPCNPHIFRHAALTHLSKHLSDQELKIYAGWSKNSKMMDVYSHLTGGDVADKILRMHNIVKDDAQVESQLLSCPRCRAPNQELADYCYNCSHILNQQIAQNTFLEKQKREQAATNKSVYAKLLDDPKVQAFLKEKLSSIIDDEL